MPLRRSRGERSDGAWGGCCLLPAGAKREALDVLVTKRLWGVGESDRASRAGCRDVTKYESLHRTSGYTLSGRASGAGLAGWMEDRGWLVVGRARLLARSLGGSVGDPEDFVGLTGLAAPALLGWGLRVIVCAWSVSVWVGPR